MNRAALLTVSALLLGAAQAQTTPSTPSTPADPAALLQQAQTLEQQARATTSRNIDDARWKQAAAAAEAAVQAAPQSQPALRLRATIYTEVGFWKQAELAWDAYLKLAPDDAAARSQAAIAQYNLGYAAYARGDLGSAPANFTRCLTLDPKQFQCALWGGRVALESGRFPEAVNLYQQAVALNGSDKVAPYFLGVAQNAGKYGPAATAAFSRAYQALDAGRKQEALSGFEAATASAPNFIEALREQGRLALELNNAASAKAAYDAAAALPGASAADRYNQSVADEGAVVGLPAVKAFRDAYSKYAAGDKVGAEAGFLAATTANPSYAKAWSWLGRSRYEQQNYTGATEAYTQAVLLDPNDKASAYYLRLSQQGK
ncbi:tetratricopeptide repeat protein [Deinococcus sonorensis]|uniref:Tetratricopeptide repeat protein n=2 Tax=Deinococcus sonorensis TaxID=309891 RepID=A0AAU7U8H8_9DEIO